MSLQYIFGGAGTGKTSFCLNEIVKSADSGNSIFYIVPEQYSLAAEKLLAERFDCNVIIKAQVLSFERLAYHVLHETGVRRANLLDSTGKAMVIRKIILNAASQLKIYGGNYPKAGLIDNISELIKEFYQYAIKPEDLKIGENAPTFQKYKFDDIRLIYSLYKEFTEGNFICSDTTLDILNENIEKSSLLDNSIIWIDNFTGFTPQEYNVVSALLKKAMSVNICINIKDIQKNYANLSIDDFYYEAKALVNKLSEIATNLNVEIKKPIILKNSYRFSNSYELKWLEENFNNLIPKKFPGKNNRVTIMDLRDKYDELEKVSSAIIDLVREKGLKFSQIAVLTGDIGSYAAATENTFKKYAIPYFIDVRIGILTHPLTEFIRSLFEVIIKNWSYESVFRLIKTGFLSFSMEDADMLENYVLAHGIKGSRWKQEEWKYGFYKGSRFDKDKIHRTKEELYEQISAFTNKYSPKAKINAGEVSRELYDYMLARKVPETLTKLSMEATKRGDLRAYREHSGIWNTALGVLDKIVGIFGETELNLTEFTEILDTGLKSCDMGIIPPAQDQVTVGDIYRSRLNEIEALFVIGATGDSFPKKCDDTGIFDDSDRMALLACGIECGVDSLKRTYINSYLSYSIVTKASGYLFIYCPKQDIDGKSLTPSPVISKIKALIDCDNPLPYLSTARAMLSMAGKAMGKVRAGASLDEFESALLNWYNNNEHYKGMVANINNENKYITPLSQESINSLYQFNVKTSVSKLENYSLCPFSYFVRYNLDAKQREEYQVRSIDLGNIFHEVLQEFFSYVDHENIPWKNLERETIGEIVDKIFANLLEKSKTDIFTDDIRASYILERVIKTVKISILALAKHISRGDFRPYGSEVDFGISSPITGITVDIGDGRIFTLTGKIDRIDIMDSAGKQYVKIIDYKSGNKKFDLTDIYYAMQLQLLIYMGALVKNGASILNIENNPDPGGVLYFRLNDPVIDYEKGLDDDTIDEKILEKFKMSGLLVKDELIIKGIDNNIGKASSIIQVNKNAQNEYTSRSGALVSKEEFKYVLDFAENKVKDIGKKITSGDVEARPYKRGLKTGCDFCDYNPICGFDPRKPGNNYRMQRRIKGIEELE